MEFVCIIGPPAVGKMAVGMALAEATGFKLFHNHASIDPVLSVFEFGTPEFWRVVDDFRMSVFAAAARSEIPGLIFTFVCDFNDESDTAYIDHVRKTFVGSGARVSFVELKADLEARLARADTPLRLSNKPTHRDVPAMRRYIEEADQKYRVYSNGAFPYPDEHLLVENDNVSAAEAAKRIVDYFGLVGSEPAQ